MNAITRNAPMLGTVSLLLVLVSAGLQWYARYATSDVASVLVALYFASWTYLIGLGGFVISFLLWLVRNGGAAADVQARQPAWGRSPVDSDVRKAA